MILNKGSPMPQHVLESENTTRIVDPCIIVIFGATGDLTARKLLPALYNLVREGQLAPQFACVGFARREKSHEEFREEAKKAINSYSRVKPIEEPLWNTFKEQIFYHISEFDDDAGYKSLALFLKELDQKLGTRGNRIFYLSTQPSYFIPICDRLKSNGLMYDEETTTDKWSRIIIEKPFGHDLDSAKALQKELLRSASENQIYRIDHYLGKETVQNILVFRFANSLFESLWNRRYVDHVQITVAEDIGIGTRGRFWEEAGLLRDIMQNHMMQLLSLVAMEPPVSLAANAIRDEKVKVLQAITPVTNNFDNSFVRGQYGAGFINGEPVCGYQDEPHVNKESHVETFGALRLFIDNWRWAGVPFYLRSGKRLAKRTTEIAITFKEPPHVLFQQNGISSGSNVLVLRIQPNEGISLRINSKVPGHVMQIQPVKMDFMYGSYFGLAPPEAYERLICDCILGDTTLFAREDEVFNSWRLLTPVLNYWKETKTNFPNYKAGTWGPEEADKLLIQDNHKWRLI